MGNVLSIQALLFQVTDRMLSLCGVNAVLQQLINFNDVVSWSWSEKICVMKFR